MNHNHHSARRLAWVTLAAVPLLWISACGGSGSDPDGAASSTTDSESAGVDLDSPGDNLLSDSRWGGDVPGDIVKASWRFPESFDPAGENVPNNEARSRDGDTEYRIVIGSYPGSDRVDQAAEELRAGAEDAGQSVNEAMVNLGDRESSR